MKNVGSCQGNSASFQTSEMCDLDLRIEFNKPTDEEISKGSRFEILF